MVDRFEDARLREAVALGYHKLLAYKDEYEVARLHQATLDRAREEFDGDLKLSYHLAPPGLSGTDGKGRPRKRAFGPWIERSWAPLARMKRLRGTPFDPFGRSEDRRLERALIAQYEADAEEILRLAPGNLDAAVALAELPLQIRGFGPVKAAHAEKAALRREELLAALRAGEAPAAQAAE